jgi:hypothetical protein
MSIEVALKDVIDSPRRMIKFLREVLKGVPMIRVILMGLRGLKFANG